MRFTWYEKDIDNAVRMAATVDRELVLSTFVQRLMRDIDVPKMAALLADRGIIELTGDAGGGPALSIPREPAARASSAARAVLAVERQADPGAQLGQRDPVRLPHGHAVRAEQEHRVVGVDPADAGHARSAGSCTRRPASATPSLANSVIIT